MSRHVWDLGTGGGGTNMPDLLRVKREDGADMPRTCHTIWGPFLRWHVQACPGLGHRWRWDGHAGPIEDKKRRGGGHATDMPGYYVPQEANRRTCHGHARLLCSPRT